MIKDLGQVAAIYIGTTEPINYTLLWLDTNTNPGVYKAYDSNLKQWVPLATQSWVQDLIDNWIQNWPVADDIVEGDYILINKGGENYKIEAQDIIQNLIGKPLNFQNIVSNGSQLPASASDLKNGDLYILNVPGDIDTQVVTQPTQQVFPNRSILFWDEGGWKSMGRVEWKCDLSMVQTSDTVTINSSLGTGITIPTATGSQAGVLSALLFTYLTKLSNGTVIPRTPNGSTQTPGHIHNYTDIEGRIIVIDTVGDINKDLDTSNPPSQRAVTEALYTKYDKTGGEISGIVRITDGTEATQLGEGALIVNGGLSIFKNVYFGENLDVVGATHLHSTLDVDGITHILNTTDSTANNNGALVVDGGVGVAKNANIGGAVDIDGNSSLHGTLTVDGATTLNSTLHTVGAVTFDNTLDVAGISNFNNTTESTAYTNGAVVVDGGVGIAKRLNVHGATDIDSTLNVDGATTLNNTLHGVGAVTFDSTLTVAGATQLNNTLGVTGIVTVTNTTDATSTTTGSIHTAGGVGIAKQLRVGGNTNLGGTLTVAGDTVLNSDLTVNGATEVQDITIHGNVTQEGQSFITKAETVEVKDNILLLNRGETAAGVSKGLSGIEVDRGTATNFQFVFDESDDYFKAGEIGDLQILLLRDADANLTNNKFFYWDNTNKIAKTREILIADISDLGATWDAQLKGAIYQKTLRVNNGNYPIYRPNNIDFPANLYAPTTLSTDSRQVIVGASSGSAPTWDFPTALKTYDKGRISALGLGRATTPSTMYTRFDIFSTNASSIPGTDSISGDQINDGVVQTYFWDNATHAVQLALDIDGTGVAYRSYNPSDGTFRGSWKFLASTSWVNSHVNEELEEYLPLTAGSSKPLTGTLHINSYSDVGIMQYPLGLIVGDGTYTRGIEIRSHECTLGLGSHQDGIIRFWRSSSDDSTYTGYFAEVDAANGGFHHNTNMFMSSGKHIALSASSYLSIPASSTGACGITNSGVSEGLNNVSLYFPGDTSMVVGNTNYTSLALRTNASSNLVHRKGTSDYTIYDSGNFIAGTNYVAPATLNNYLPLSGGTLTGALHITSGGLNVTSGRIRGVEARGVYINGKTLTNALLSASLAQVSNSYSPYFAAQMLNGDVVNIGGIGNKFGIYGYDAARTENGQDWLFEFNSDDGSLNNSICLGSESNTAYLRYRIRRSGVTTEFSNSGTELNLSITNGSTNSAIKMTPTGGLTFNSNNIYHAGNTETRQLAFNGTNYPVIAPDGGTSTLTWYAPTTQGEAYQVLMSNGNNTPIWNSINTVINNSWTDLATHKYDSTNGIRFIWNKIGALIGGSSTRQVQIRIRAYEDNNYPSYSEWIMEWGVYNPNGTAAPTSRNLYLAPTTYNSNHLSVGIDEDFNIWIRSDVEWDCNLQFKIEFNNNNANIGQIIFISDIETIDPATQAVPTFIYEATDICKARGNGDDALTDFMTNGYQYLPKTRIQGDLTMVGNIILGIVGNEGSGTSIGVSHNIPYLWFPSATELVIGNSGCTSLTLRTNGANTLYHQATASGTKHKIFDTGNFGSITFTGAATGTFNGTNNITVNIPQGGGTADSVAWENVTGKPSWIGSSKPTYSYSEISGTVPISDIPTGTSSSTVALGNHTHNTLYAVDDRDIQPSATGLSGSKGIRPYFRNCDDIVSEYGTYADFLYFDTYSDNSGGGVNGLAMCKNSMRILHYQGIWNGSWTTVKPLAYLDDIPDTVSISISGGGVTSNQYVSGLSYSNGVISVSKGTLPTVSLSALGITATAAEINKLDGLTATTTELNYVDGVTSNIQTQLNGKAASTHTHTVAQINNLGINWSARLTAAINVKSVNINGTATSYLNTTNATAVTIYAPTSAGTDGYLLVSNGSGAPSWASVSSVIGTGFVTIDTAQTITGAKTFTAYTIFSNGAGTATSSDKRLKENIKEITYNKGFDEISLYSYNFKGRKEEKIGLIAQEVQKVIPQAVIKDEEGYLAIDTYPIVATLVAANGERVREVKDLKSEIDNLKQEIEMLKQEISILKRIVRL